MGNGLVGKWLLVFFRFVINIVLAADEQSQIVQLEVMIDKPTAW